jgi:hypothetical protein
VPAADLPNTSDSNHQNTTREQISAEDPQPAPGKTPDGGKSSPRNLLCSLTLEANSDAILNPTPAGYSGGEEAWEARSTVVDSQCRGERLRGEVGEKKSQVC